MSASPDGEGATFLGSTQYTAAEDPYSDDISLMFTGGSWSPESGLTATLTDAQGSTGAFSSNLSGYDEEAAPVFNFSAETLTFTYPEGITPIGTQAVDVSNSGGHLGTLRATSAADWIIIEPDSLALDTGNASSVSITVDGRDMAAGSYVDTVWFHTNALQNPHQGLAITMNIAVDPQNTRPVAVQQFHLATPGEPVEFTLSGWDEDGDPLNIYMVSDPIHGSLSGLLPQFIYTSDEDFVGRDSLRFGVSDGLLADTASIHFNVAHPGTMLLEGQVVLTNASGPEDCPVVLGNRPYVELVYEACGEQTLGQMVAVNMASVNYSADVTLRMGGFVMEVDSFACLDSIWGDYRLYAGGTAVIEDGEDTLLYLENVDLRSIQNFLNASMEGEASGDIVHALSDPEVVAELDPFGHGVLHVPFEAWNPIVQADCGYYDFSFLLEPNMEPVENEPPTPFVLLEPQNDEIFHITAGMDNSIDLSWEASEDPEGQSVSYVLEWSSEAFGLHEEILEEPDFDFDVDSLLFYMELSEVMETQISWQVSATDGEVLTMASDAPRVFTVIRHELPENSLLFEGQVVLTNASGPQDCPVVPGNRPYVELVYEACGEQTLAWALSETTPALDDVDEVALRMGNFVMEVDSFACLDSIWGDYRLYTGGTAVIQDGDDTLLFIENVELRSVQNFTTASMNGHAVGDINVALSDASFLSDFDTRDTRRVSAPFEAWNPIVQGDCGTYGFSFMLQADTAAVVNLAENQQLPATFQLEQNYPNPFNPSTTIRYGLPEDSRVNLVIYDIRGNIVQSIQTPDRSSGWHEYVWNGLNQNKQPVATGIYLARLTTPTYSKTIKMLYLK